MLLGEGAQTLHGVDGFVVVDTRREGVQPVEAEEGAPNEDCREGEPLRAGEGQAAVLGSREGPGGQKQAADAGQIEGPGQQQPVQPAEQDQGEQGRGGCQPHPSERLP